MPNSAARIVREIISDLRTLPGLGEAPDTPPDALNGPWPALVCYAESGAVRLNSTRGPHDMPSVWALHTITIRLHVPRKDLGFDVTALMAFVDSVPEAILASFIRDRMGGSVVALGDARSPGASAAIRYEIGNDSWGSVDTLAIRFTIDVTAENAVEEEL